MKHSKRDWSHCTLESPAGQQTVRPSKLGAWSLEFLRRLGVGVWDLLFARSCAAPHALFAGTVLLVAPCVVGAVTFPLTWRWSNPKPHGDEVFDFASTGGFFLEACERGRIYLSDDLADW